MAYNTALTFEIDPTILTERRISLGLKVFEAEDIIGIKRGRLTLIERGRMRPNIEDLNKLRRFYGIETPHLILTENSINKAKTYLQYLQTLLN